MSVLVLKVISLGVFCRSINKSNPTCQGLHCGGLRSQIWHNGQLQSVDQQRTAEQQSSPPVQQGNILFIELLIKLKSFHSGVKHLTDLHINSLVKVFMFLDKCLHTVQGVTFVITG